MKPTQELPPPSPVPTPDHRGKEASTGGIFNPGPQAEYHITGTTCQQVGNQWIKKGVWDHTLMRNNSFQRGSSACFQVPLQEPFDPYYPSLGYSLSCSLNLLIKLVFKDQQIREGMILPIMGFPKKKNQHLEVNVYL